MTGSAYVALPVGVSAAVTWALRALPFVALAPLRHSAVVRYLSLHMPLGVMVVLAMYTARPTPNVPVQEHLWLAIAAAATVGLYLWRRQAVLSILAGTAAYVALMSIWP